MNPETLPSRVTAVVQLAGVTADRARRTIRGRIVPYGQVGHTNAGPLIVMGPGRLRLPDPISRHVLLYGHGPDAPSVGVLTAYEDQADGLWGTFVIAAGDLGDQLLRESDPDGDAPVRTGLSFELHDVTWDEPPAGLDALGVRDALVLATASVPIPAFPDARVATVVATLHPAQEGTPPVDPETPATAPTAPATETTPAAPVTAPAPAAEVTAAAVAPAALPAGHPTTGTGVEAPEAAATGQHRAPRVVAGIHTVDQFAGAMAAFVRGERTPAVMAALSDVAQAAHPAVAPAAFEGQLWRGARYARTWARLFSHKPLTSFRIEGYRWVTPPIVGRWDRTEVAGAVPAIPSRKVVTEPVTAKPVRFAGGQDLDRAVVDFHMTEFVREYYEEQTEQYGVITDEYFREQLLSYVVPALDADGTAVDGTPVGFEAVGKPATMLKAAAVASAMLKETPNVRQRAGFVLVNTIDWLELADIVGDDLPALLALFGVSPDNLIPDLGVAPGTLVAGVQAAQSKYEFGDDGEPPIRVEALNVSQGAVTGGVFGYAATINNRPGGVISVPFGAVAP